MTFTVRIPQIGATGPSGNQIIEKSNVAPGTEDGAIGDMAVRFNDDGDVLLYGKKTPGGWPAGRSVRGPQGTAGWSPIITAVAVTTSVVLRLIDWVGGAGDKPGGVGKYIGSAGLVDDPEDAVQFSFSALAKNVAYDATESGFIATNVQDAIDRLVADLPWYAVPIGGVFYAETSLAGAAIPPQSHPDLVFVKLTAGEDGSGEYNEGKLVSESVSGAFPLTIATAVIDIAASPMYGQTIHLLNTEGRILRPSETDGGLQQDQMQQIIGELGAAGANGVYGSSVLPSSGAIKSSLIGGITATGGSGGSYNYIEFNSATSPNARTGSENRMKNMGITGFRRVA